MKNKKFIIASVLGALLHADIANAMEIPNGFENGENVERLWPLLDEDQARAEENRFLLELQVGDTTFSFWNVEERFILNFQDRNLQDLQQEHFDFSQFRLIRVQGNGFENLNWLPARLPELRELVLDNNLLTSLNFPVMLNLIHLQLLNNPLTNDMLLNAPWYNVRNLTNLILPDSIEEGCRQKNREDDTSVLSKCKHILGITLIKWKIKNLSLQLQF